MLMALPGIQLGKVLWKWRHSFSRLSLFPVSHNGLPKDLPKSPQSNCLRVVPAAVENPPDGRAPLKTGPFKWYPCSPDAPVGTGAISHHGAPRTAAELEVKGRNS